MSYDNVCHMTGIYPLQTFCAFSVPVTLGFGPILWLTYHMAGPSNDGNLFYIGTMTPFAFGHVNVGGAHIHKESMQTPLLTRSTYKASCFGCAI